MIKMNISWVRKISLIAILSAVAISSRFLLAFIPQVKPILAIVVLAGAVCGADVGVLVALITFGISNMIFGQGPWTIWQIAAACLVGFISCFVPNKKFVLASFGFFAAILIYGLIMNISSVFMFSSILDLKTIAAYEISGLPFDIVQGVSTFVFVFLLLKPMEKIVFTYSKQKNNT